MDFLPSSLIETFLKFKPWSYSKLARLMQCPYLFHVHENKLTPKEELDLPNLNALHGTVIHEFLDKVFTNELSIKDFYTFVNSYPAPQSVKDKVLTRIASVESLHKQIKMHVGQTGLTSEFTLTLTSEFEKCDKSEKEKVVFKAIVDLLAVKDDTLIIIDHKSTVKKVDEFKNQMMFYNIMATYWFPEVKTINTYISDLKSGKLLPVFILKTGKIKTGLVKGYFAQLVPLLEEYIKDPLPKKNKNCKWCLVERHCPLFTNS